MLGEPTGKKCLFIFKMVPAFGKHASFCDEIASLDRICCCNVLAAARWQWLNNDNCQNGVALPMKSGRVFSEGEVM